MKTPKNKEEALQMTIKYLEERLAQVHDELNRSYAEHNSTLDKLEKAYKEIHKYMRREHYLNEELKSQSKLLSMFVNKESAEENARKTEIELLKKWWTL